MLGDGQPQPATPDRWAPTKTRYWIPASCLPRDVMRLLTPDTLVLDILRAVRFFDNIVEVNNRGPGRVHFDHGRSQ